ncbi:AaceriAGR269Wp [[Ashbya] aceris (nom. inval.)]|nr:AaceriAGR269Wp [[Ashbya] aceris (nom. inval.)]
MSTTSVKRGIGFDTDSETEADTVHIDKRRKRRLQPIPLPKNPSDADSEEEPEDTSADDDDYLTMELPPDEPVSPQPAGVRRKEAPESGAPPDLRASMPKGFQMMEKMGYKTGDVLGTGDGLTRALRQPLRAMGQKTRSGIKQRPSRADGEAYPEKSVAEYREWLHGEESKRRNAAVLARMQKIAFELTGDIDLVTPESDARDFNVLWRRHVILLLDRYHPQSSTASSSSDGTPGQPASGDGLNVEVDPDLAASPADETDIPGDSELELFEDLSLEEQIAQLHNFLRAELRYCFYCGTKYANDEDLYEHCPGFTEEDHH